MCKYNTQKYALQVYRILRYNRLDIYTQIEFIIELKYLNLTTPRRRDIIAIGYYDDIKKQNYFPF